MNKKVLWIGGVWPPREAHGRGLAEFRRLVESETDGELAVKITWNIMDEGRPLCDRRSAPRPGSRLSVSGITGSAISPIGFARCVPRAIARA